MPRHSPYALSSLTFLLRFLKHFSLLLIFLNCSLSVLIVLNCTILSYTSFTLLYIFFNVLFLFVCLNVYIYWNLSSNIMVGPNGLEPSTSRLSGVRSNHLSYGPIYLSTFKNKQYLFRIILLRKEVIQPHLPIRLPCYDFTPIISSAFDGWLLAVTSPASGVSDSHSVTGGVYKARERIHRGMLTRDY